MGCCAVNMIETNGSGKRTAVRYRVLISTELFNDFKARAALFKPWAADTDSNQ
jgi:hypothetical protein